MADEDILIRFVDFYGNERIFADGLVPSLRLKLSSLSVFMREIKVSFARYYNGFLRMVEHMPKPYHIIMLRHIAHPPPRESAHDNICSEIQVYLNPLYGQLFRCFAHSIKIIEFILISNRNTETEACACVFTITFRPNFTPVQLHNAFR